MLAQYLWLLTFSYKSHNAVDKKYMIYYLTNRLYTSDAELHFQETSNVYVIVSQTLSCMY